MRTRCPYPDCSHEFEVGFDVPEGDWHFPQGHCPHCARLATFRPMSVLETIEKLRLKREQSGTICSAIVTRAEERLVCVLEDIRSLWNVGAMFRTSDGAGVDGIYLCGVTGCPPQKGIAKTSLGAEETIPWSFSPGVVPVIEKLRTQGFQIIGLERNPQSQPLHRIDSAQFKERVCLVVGNEVTGISAEGLSLCDIVAHLPMRGVKESLNVAVAFGIAVYLVADKVLE